MFILFLPAIAVVKSSTRALPLLPVSLLLVHLCVLSGYIGPDKVGALVLLI